MKRVKRLYSEFKPEHYELYLEPDREKSSFSGKVVITGRKTGRPSQRITLHQKGLKIKSAKLTRHDKKSGSQVVEIDRVNTHNAYDELRLHAKQMLYPGSYTIEVEFSGKIKDQMHGIYPCNFEYKGKKLQLIATQFESHHAREAFPCVDEPEAKATFDLSLLTPKGETVVANTPVKTQTIAKNGLLTSFETTPKMSTYLLAFAYGQLGYKEAKASNGVAVRVYATPGNVKLTEFALDTAVRCLEFFEEYFGVPYPLPKLDLIGLPDFSAGAMENWGLITFRESVLYVDPKSSSVDTKQFVAMVVCHEIAHMWFGNLVTMKWWNDLWLNESFANLMEYRAVDELYPKWKIWEMFAYREVGSALNRDALPTVQAVRTDVNHPDELSSIFDPSIVYAKGGSLLNMVRNLIGEDSFKRGLKSYFEQYAYGNTIADDLWRHLGDAGGFDIQSMMSQWLQKPGYPLIDVDYAPGAKMARLSQRRLAVGAGTEQANTLWQVPLAAAVPLNKSTLSKRAEDFELKKPSSYPLVLNHDAHSYFVSRYLDKTHFESILAAAKDGVLSPIDRLLLVQSYLLLERVGEVLTTDNLKLLESLGGDYEDAVWSNLAGIIGNARLLMYMDDAAHERFDAFVLPILRPLVAKLGWDGHKDDSSQVIKLRGLILTLAAVAKDKAVIDSGLKKFRDFKVPSDLPSDIRSVVYYIGIRYGTDQDFEKLIKLHRSVSNADEKDAIAAEITATRNPELIARLLKMMKSDDVRSQDMPTWFAWLMRNRYATEQTWQWLHDNWDWVAKKYGDDKSYDHFPRYAANAFSFPAQLKSYREFFEPKANIALRRPVKLGIEEIEARVAWRRKNETKLKDWLSQAR